MARIPSRRLQGFASLLIAAAIPFAAEGQVVRNVTYDLADIQLEQLVDEIAWEFPVRAIDPIDFQPDVPQTVTFNITFTNGSLRTFSPWPQRMTFAGDLRGISGGMCLGASTRAVRFPESPTLNGSGSGSEGCESMGLGVGGYFLWSGVTIAMTALEYENVTTYDAARTFDELVISGRAVEVETIGTIPSPPAPLPVGAAAPAALSALLLATGLLKPRRRAP